MNSTGPAKLTLQQAGAIYSGFMEEIKTRLAAIDDCLGQIEAGDGGGNSYLYAEFAFLQLRMVCELLALAVLSAHNEIPEAATGALLKEWQADKIFSKLEALNPHCFPMPLQPNRDAATGQLHFNRVKGSYLTRDHLKRLYGDCGDSLHRGALKHVFAGRIKAYDAAEIRRYRADIERLLNEHVILLPELGKVAFVQLHGEGGLVAWHAAATLDGGEFTVETAGL